MNLNTSRAYQIRLNFQEFFNQPDRESGELNSGFIEGMNALIQAAKSKARGYRSDKNFIAIAYLLGAKLKFDLPT